MKTLFGLPKKYYSVKNLISNQRPNSAIEFKHNSQSKKKLFECKKWH